MKKWLDKHLIIKQEDTEDLERQAATNQYVSGMSKEHAELSAYQRYKKIQHEKAAAYHLDGMEDGKSIKAPEMYNKHWAMYVLHMNALGLNPLTTVPPNISTFRDDDRNISHVFKPCQGDLLVLHKGY